MKQFRVVPLGSTTGPRLTVPSVRSTKFQLLPHTPTLGERYRPPAPATAPASGGPVKVTPVVADTVASSGVKQVRLSTVASEHTVTESWRHKRSSTRVSGGLTAGPMCVVVRMGASAGGGGNSMRFE